jgi:hypothetical protein
MEVATFFIKNSSEKYITPHPGSSNLVKIKNKNMTPICRFVTMGLYGNFRETSDDDSRKRISAIP